MGKIASATTVYAQAYLTELGRQYIFNSEKTPRYVNTTDENGNAVTIDKLQVTRFSLGDPDMNYGISSRLASGDIPDLSGENENAITGAKGRYLNNLIAPGDALFTVGSTAVYSTSKTLPIDMDIRMLSVFVTQSTENSRQLLLYIDGQKQNDLATHGIFNIFPSNYAKTMSFTNGIYSIILRKTTSTEDGYGIAIFPPLDSYGVSSWDRVTVKILKILAGTTAPINVTSLPINSTEYTLVSNLIKDFIDTDESGTKAARDTENGREKNILFSFNYTNPVPPTDTEVGTFTIHFEYPSEN